MGTNICLRAALCTSHNVMSHPVSATRKGFHTAEMGFSTTNLIKLCHSGHNS